MSIRRKASANTKNLPANPAEAAYNAMDFHQRGTKLGSAGQNETRGIRRASNSQFRR